MAKESKSSIFKIILIFFIVFVIVPIGIMILVYFNNDTFNNKANNILKKLPGAIGTRFNNSLIIDEEKEIDNKKEYLAKHYLSLDSKIASDKLYIVKEKDRRLYDDIIKKMTSNSVNKTKEIVKLIRDIELREDLLINLYDEIKTGEENDLINKAKRLEKLDIIIALEEIKQNIYNNPKYIDELSKTMTQLREEKTAEILYYLDEEIKNVLLKKFNDDKKQSILIILNEKKFENEKLKDVANLYEYKDPIKSVEEIGNTNKYNIQELSKIYKNLSIETASNILVNVQDDEFKDELFNAMKKEEILNNEEESITEKINEAINYMKNYNNKIGELVGLYEKMEPEEAAKIVEKMMYNYTQVSSLEIDSIPFHKISDAIIIEDVLKKMNKTKLSKILSQMDSRKAADLTRRLAIP